MIKYWKHAWDTYMMKVKADKFWHFIAFLFFTIALHIAQLSDWIILPVVAILAIGKEIWDKNHGSFFDPRDLMADIIGVFFAYVIDGMYIQILTQEVI